MGLQDAKGKQIPAWARSKTKILASGSLEAQKTGGNEIIPFALYCPDAAVVSLKLIDDASASSINLLAGYHPLAVESVDSTDVDIWALFA